MDIVFEFVSLVVCCSHRVVQVMDQFKAAQRGDLQKLRVVLTADNVNDDEYGWTALHWAANGHFDCVIYCIKMGANVHARINDGWTPLHIASMHGHANVVRVLLDVGALVDVTDDNGRTSFYYGIRDKYVDVARYLIDRGAKISNVRLGNYLPAIPDWVTTFIDSRSNCRCVSIAIIGTHKYRRTTMTGNNDINVLRLIGKHIWSTRMNNAWVAKK
jgi:ankyrin repeat protein